MFSRVVAVIAALGCAIALVPAAAMLAALVRPEGAFSLEPIRATFSDPSRLGFLLGNSLKVGGGAVAVALLLGAPCGFLCFRTDLPFRRWIVAGCLLASGLPLYVTVTAWLALPGAAEWLPNAAGAALVTGLAYAPLAALIAGAGFAAGNRELEDLASLDAGRWGVFWHTTLPAASGSLAAAALVILVLSLWDISVTDILLVRTFAEEVFTQFQLGAGAGRAAALALPAIPLLGGAWLLAARLLQRHGDVLLAGHLEPPTRLPLGRARRAIGAAVLAGAAVCLGIPGLALLRTVGSWSNLVDAWSASGRELGESLRVLPLAATLGLALALAAAWARVRVPRLAPWVAGLVIVLISVPAPVIGIGLIHTFDRPGPVGELYDSRAVLVLAYVIRALPFGILALIPAIRSIPRDLEDAMALDGAPWLRRLVSIVIPLRWRAVLAAWFLMLAFSLAEMGASFLVYPPGHATLTTRFFTLIHYGVYSDAAGLCLLFLLLVGGVGGLLAALVWPWVKGRLS